MQIFELHFNPKLKDHYLFDSFVYEPTNIYEKKMGSLYIVAEIRNALPSDPRLLQGLAKTIKGKYYALSAKSPEKSLSQSLKTGNDFLAEEIKSENVNWLGNLNIAAVSLKDFNLVFTKAGNLKILLIRGSQITDIGKTLDAAEINPYPLKFFSNIVSGRLNENDAILLLTKNVGDFFQKEKILNKMASAAPLDEKKLKNILPPDLFAKGEGAEIAGICFLVLLKNSPIMQEKIRQIYIRPKERFSFKKVFLPEALMLKRFFTALGKIRKMLPVLSKIKKLWPVKKKIRVKVKADDQPKKKPVLPRIGLAKLSLSNRAQRRKIIIILLFLLTLVLGYLFFK